jgi:hypothetical protein
MGRKPTHGVYFWLKTGRINPSIRGFRKLQNYLESMEKDLIESQGGAEHLTPAREILIKATIEAYGVVLLASMYCKREGILRPDRLKEGVIELQPVLGRQMLNFMSLLKQNLVALGLDPREAEKAFDVVDYAEKKYGNVRKGKERKKDGRTAD